VRLVDLEPRWVGYGGEDVTHNGEPVPRRERVALSFLCPCGKGERVTLMLRNPPDGGPNPIPELPAWERSGEDFASMSLTPSIQRRDPGGCQWHGFLTDGVFRSC